MQRFARHAVTGLALLAALSVTACDDDETSPTKPAASPARVMAVHASPDAPAVDVLVDGAVVGTGLSFPNNSSYLNVNAGTRNVQVNVTGTSTTVINADLPVQAGMSYSVFAKGAVASIGALVLEDDLTAPAAGKAHVRFVHLSPDAPAVDVAVTGGPVLFANKAFGEYSAFAPVDAGSYNLEVRPAGSATVVLSLSASLQAGKIYTVFARGFLSGSGAQALNAQIIENN